MANPTGTRLCDCGCGRAVVFTLRPWDLGFSEKCKDKYDEACERYNRWLGGRGA